MLLLLPFNLLPRFPFPVLDDPSATDNLILVVEDSGLARRDGALRLIKDYSHPAIS